ncbi:MAG: DUF4870 domain-containing protein [Planctomycetota bacterium]
MKTVVSERKHAQWIHLSVAAPMLPGIGHITGIVVCLILWIMKRDESQYIDDHGREALNFHISMGIYGLIAGLLCFVIIGFPLVLLLWVVIPISAIRGALAAGRGETFRYPICLRFVK